MMPKEKLKLEKEIDFFRFDMSEWETQCRIDLQLAEFVSEMFRKCSGVEWTAWGESFRNPDFQDVMNDFFPVHAFIMKPLKQGLSYAGIRDVGNVVIEIGHSSNFNHELPGYSIAPTFSIFEQIDQGNLLAIVRTNRNCSGYYTGIAWQTRGLEQIEFSLENRNR